MSMVYYLNTKVIGTVFSNPDFEWENEIDYLILGDAYAHGNCVKQEDSISGILRKLNGGKEY